MNDQFFFFAAFLIGLDFKTAELEEESSDESESEESLFEEVLSSFFLLLFLGTILSLLIESLYVLFHHWSFQSKLSAAEFFIPSPFPSSRLLI